MLNFKTQSYLKYLILFIIIIWNINYSANSEVNPQLQKARELYYKATLKEDFLEDAITAFENVSKTDSKLKPITDTYIGSLTALKGKYTYWPQKKFSYANEGIDMMETVVNNTNAKNQDNIEVMFIYGSTCNYLPFFFNKGDEAKSALKQVIKLLEKDYQKIDKELVGYITKFLNEKIEMTEQEKKIVENAAKVSSKNSVN